MSDGRLALDARQKRRVVSQEQDHENGEWQHTCKRGEHAHDNAGSVIVGRFVVVAVPGAQGHPQKSDVDDAVEHAQVVILAQIEEVHEQEEPGEAEEHPKAVTKSDVFHDLDRFGEKVM